MYTHMHFVGSKELAAIQLEAKVEDSTYGPRAYLALRAGTADCMISGPTADVDAFLQRLAGAVTQLRRDIAWHAEMEAEKAERLAEVG